jgi:hypothetical protein
MSEANLHPGVAARSNKRTALILLSIGAVFFFGIMLKVWVFGK